MNYGKQKKNTTSNHIMKRVSKILPTTASDNVSNKIFKGKKVKQGRVIIIEEKEGKCNKY